MTGERIQVSSTVQVNDPRWVDNPDGRRVEAALSVALMDATWGYLENQLGVKVLSDTWPYLLKFASVHIDYNDIPCPEELVDSIISFARTQYSDHLWHRIGGAFTPKLAKTKPGTFRVGQTFQLKVSINKVQKFAFDVGPIVVPKSSFYEGGVIKRTHIELRAELSEDLKLTIPLAPEADPHSCF